MHQQSFACPRPLPWIALTTAAILLAPAGFAQEKRAFADYFTFLNERDASGSSGTWQYYDQPSATDFYPRVRWSGDVYLAADKKEISGSFYPLIGPYAASDPDVREYHVLTAIAAGFDGFIFEWTMTGLPLDGNCGQIQGGLNATQTIAGYAAYGQPLGFEVGLNWTCSLTQEYSGCYGAASRQTYLDQAAWDLDYMLDNIYSVDGIHVGSRPLVLLFSASSSGSGGTAFHPSDLVYLRNSPYLAGHDPLLLSRASGALDVNMLPEADGFFGWKKGFSSAVFVNPWTQTTSVQDEADYVQDFAMDCAALSIPHLISAIPRFDDHKGRAWGSGEKRYTPTADGSGETLDSTLAEWSGASTDIAFVVTWNDEEEATIIEPSREFGFRNLDACLDGISSWKNPGQPAPGVDDHALIRLPERLHRVRKGIRLIEAAIDRSLNSPSQALLDELELATDSADAAASLIADRDIAAVADLVSAETSVASAMALLKVVRIDATWRYDDVSNPAIQACGTPTLWPTTPLDGKQGALVSNTPNVNLNLDLIGAVGSAMSTGAFVGTATVELIETNDNNSLYADWLWCVVDAPLDAPNLSLTRLSKESGGWIELQFDLVNGLWSHACPSPDISFATFNNDPSDHSAATAIRRVRIEGFAYQVQ